jgi:hypothetical protein
MSNKTIVLFTTSEVISSMKNKPEQLTKLRLLEKDEKMIDQKERFGSSEDLIFQLVDDSCRYYTSEAKDDLTFGNTSLAKEKEELVNQIHNEMEKVHKTFSTNNMTTQPLVCTSNTLICLKSKLNDDLNMENLQKPLKKFISSYLTFDDEKNCYDHVCRNEVQNCVFLIIHTDYDGSVVTHFEKLPNVKNVYRYGQSSFKNKISITNDDDLYFKLIHGLIAHYNKLGAAFNARKDSDNAANMYSNARELCFRLLDI